jgi:hypothetical protein
MTDEYDFKWNNYNGLVNALNDAADVGQNFGIVSKYPININFNYAYTQK